MMQVVILAGGLGSRLQEETTVKPKPMVEIGGMPILWHIMKIYSHYGLNNFVICAGYKGYVIKEYFANYFMHHSDITFDMHNNKMEIHNHNCEPWRVTVVDTGETTNTGGRLKRVRNYLNDETFCCTYGDGVCDVNIKDLIDYHKEQGVMATLTAVQPPGRFGAVDIEAGLVTQFREKPKGEGGWINGGFFVLEPAIFDYIRDDNTSWEQEALHNISAERQLSAFRHNGFWHPMDTLRDKMRLEYLWEKDQAYWKVW